MQVKDAEQVRNWYDLFTAMELSGICGFTSLPNTVFSLRSKNNKILGYIGMYLSIDEGEIKRAVSRKCSGIGGACLLVAKKGREPLGRQNRAEVRCSNDSAIRLYAQWICKSRRGRDSIRKRCLYWRYMANNSHYMQNLLFV